jgi:hypothetical protein
MSVRTLPPWFLDGTRFKYGLVKERPKNVPAHVAVREWPEVYAEWKQFDLWRGWVLGHKSTTRPHVWTSVPGWAWTIAGELDQRLRHTPPPKRKLQPPRRPAPSWSLPGPLVMTASNPDAANDHAGVGTIGRIIDQTDACPLWECKPTSGTGRGLLGQIEGRVQVQQCLDLIKKHRQDGDHLAVVCTLNVDASPLVNVGVNVCFAEMNAQAGWEPYGNAVRMLAQAYADGWTYAEPSYGCYWQVGLADYEQYVPMVWSQSTNGFVAGRIKQGLPGKQFAVFSAEGATDAGRTWEVIAAL